MERATKTNLEFLSERDLEEMGIASRRTLQGWRLSRRGPPYYKVSGGMVRYRWTDVEAWLAERAIVPAGGASQSEREGYRRS